jgi:hypothetical protein
MDVKRVSIQNDSPLFTRYVYLCTLHIGQTLGVTCKFLTAGAAAAAAAADEATLHQYDWMYFKTKVGLEKAVGGADVLIQS